MPFQTSPGVNTSEIDLTTVVPSVSTTEAAIAGVFRWGPTDERILVSSEDDLVNRFGKPTNSNAETFFSAADFLSYSNKLFVSRVVSNTASITTMEDADGASNTFFSAKYFGEIGNSLIVSICPSASAFEGELTSVVAEFGSNVITVDTTDGVSVGDIVTVGKDSIGYQDMTVWEVTDTTTLTFEENFRLAETVDLIAHRKWGHYRLVDGAPAPNNVHVAVADGDGGITGRAGTILEVFNDVSVNENAKTPNGSNNFYKSVIENRSQWIKPGEGTFTGAENDNIYLAGSDGSDGESESEIGLGDLARGYDLYRAPEDVDISLIITGKSRLGTDDTGLANYILDNITTVRKDCVQFVSPAHTDVVNNRGGERRAIETFVASLQKSNYLFVDSGYKYRYDKYNDVYRYTPLNGDMAGLAARTDNSRDPWFSFAGLEKGKVKNVVKLAYNPDKPDRDLLYAKYVNPVITKPGNGTFLFGDKTHQGYASAFDRVNVRRLFIVLRKSISKAAETTLFQFNDEFTRAQFRNLVEPNLRDVQGRRGIYNYRVVCDETNNTPEVIDRNEFRGDIYVKPAKSINFIQLNFVSVRSGIEFEEIVGSFG